MLSESERAMVLLRFAHGLSFDEIARRVGYAEPSTLRRLMRREGRMQKVARPARYEGASK